MIEYDPHRWRSHLFDVRGSMVREIFPRVLAMGAWAAVVVGAYHTLVARGVSRGLAIDATAHSLVGMVLGLLLVFRTNSSYDRFWEGRKLWGGIVNETRNLGRAARVHLQEVPATRDRVLLGTIGFAYAAMHHLRRKGRRRPRQSPPPAPVEARHAFGPLVTVLSLAEQEAILEMSHPPLAVATWITQEIRQARTAGILSDYVMMAIDQNVQLLIDYLGGCERIHSTPMPYAYMVHARRALILYCGTLPFALVGGFGWAAIPAPLFLAFLFLGIEEIGVEIEDPFGEDENDLPLERICRTIERDLRPEGPTGSGGEQ